MVRHEKIKQKDGRHSDFESVTEKMTLSPVCKQKDSPTNNVGSVELAVFVYQVQYNQFNESLN